MIRLLSPKSTKNSVLTKFRTYIESSKGFQLKEMESFLWEPPSDLTLSFIKHDLQVQNQFKFKGWRNSGTCFLFLVFRCRWVGNFMLKMQIKLAKRIYWYLSMANSDKKAIWLTCSQILLYNPSFTFVSFQPTTCSVGWNLKLKMLSILSKGIRFSQYLR